MSDKVFWGQRTTKYEEVKAEVLTQFSESRTVLKIGDIATHLRCGLLEAERILERMSADGILRYLTDSEKYQSGVTFGYMRA